jgi:release factor glutamine methyltransferase
MPIGGPEKYDIIVSNPPYVMDSEKTLMRTNVLDHEPHLALFVPDEDALKFYKAIALHASGLLKEDGFGIVEINEALGSQTAELFAQVGFRTEVVKDLFEKDRFVKFSR